MAADAWHPDLAAAARWLPSTLLSARRPWLSRRALQMMQPQRRRGCDEVVRVGQASVRVHYPAGREEPTPALLWIHGGGYVVGRAAQDDRFCAQIAAELGVVVAAVDYRLAPEHRFPAALDDCADALGWLASLAAVNSAAVAIGGNSAGGGLAAALAVRAVHDGAVAPIFQLLTYPMLDDRTATRADAHADERRFRLWNDASNAYGWRSYLGLEPGAPSVHELAAPARAADLTGLPPAWIGVGTRDLFFDECRSYGARLEAAGVACELSVVDGAFHGFDVAVPRAAVSRAFRATQLGALRRGLRLSTT